MFSTTDTIVAIATPGGRGGLGIVRLSGPEAHDICRALITRDTPLRPRRATLSTLAAGGLTDQVVATYFPRPHSYTTEDIVEISAHGSPLILRSIVRESARLGARVARPGEFTFRAFLNGRIDLTQAEAVADLIDAVTPAQARAASAQLEGALASRLRAIDAGLFDLIARLEASLDFPDEGYHFIEPQALAQELRHLRIAGEELLSSSAAGQLLREGAHVVLTGRPNVGKSSLFNALCRSDRAIVAAAPGTTRDVLVEAIDLNGIPLSLVDTAGIRTAEDEAEQEGVRRAASAAAASDLVMVLLDLSLPLGRDDRELLASTSRQPRILVASKCDRPHAWDPAALAAELGESVGEVSALTNAGLEPLLDAISQRLAAAGELAATAAVTNERHVDLLHRFVAAMDRALESVSRLGPAAPEEVLLVDLNDARAALDDIAGRRTADDVLARIFERFCIGK